MNKDELFERVKALSLEEWNHYFELPHGIITRQTHINSPGYCINKWNRLSPLLESIGIKDKTVIDIGCSDGYFCIETAKLGAKHVHGTDVDEVRIKRANLVKEVMNIENVSFDAISLYDSSTEEKYDVALGLGLLHRVPDIEACIEYLGNVADTLVLEFKMFKDSRNICYNPQQETKSNSYNKLYGVPTRSFVETRLEKMGFTNNKFIFDEVSHLNYPRTILISSKE
jgi:predicted RNA methylase